MRIPFLDLKAQHMALEEELVEVFRAALRNARFIGGSELEAFEEEFAGFCGAPYCVGVSSGTDALRFALIASGVRPGDEVVTVPNTFIATTEAISQAGAAPVFVDINEQTYNMDPEKLRVFLDDACHQGPTGKPPINRATRSPVTAVVPVHLYGQPADMDRIQEIADHHGLTVIEDACQAHGADYLSRKGNESRKAGSMGAAAAFSFYAGKNLGACGEAGAVTTHSRDVAERVRMLRDHGQREKYFHEMEGYNGRLDAIQAGILRVKLRHLPAWNERRRELAHLYTRLLDDTNGIITPYEAPWARSAYHLYVIRSKVRDQLREALLRYGIATAFHYPIPLHLQKAYEGRGYGETSFPVAERVAAELLSLPMYPELGTERVEEVSTRIREFHSANRTTLTDPQPADIDSHAQD
jgi:dTDP-4-amino-4,6-dideoxygalactose transaminase